MAEWLDWVIIMVIVIVGLAIFYKALKEPLDLIGGGIKRGLLAIKDKLSGESSYEVIQYG